MKKMLNSKKGFAVTAVIIILLLIGIGLGGTATFKFFSDRDLGTLKYCVLENGKEKCYKPTQTTFVEKQCFVEGAGCRGERKTNTPLEFRRVCKLLQETRGKNTDASFLSINSDCLTCSDYYREEILFEGVRIDPNARVSKTSCEDNKFEITENTRCDNEADCKKEMSGIVNILDIETHVPQAKSPEERKEKTEESPCPNIVLGFSSMPDYFCKAEIALKKFFLPFRIMASIIGAIIGWLVILWIFNTTIKIKQKKAIMPIAIIIGLIVGTTIWFLWYIGLALLMIILILRLFIWK